MRVQQIQEGTKKAAGKGVHNRKQNRKKPLWHKILAVLLTVVLIVTGGHFFLLFAGKIVRQNLTSYTAALSEEKVQVGSGNLREQAQTVQLAYLLSSAAYSAQSHSDWNVKLQQEGFSNVIRVENGLKKTLSEKWIPWKKRANLLLSSVNATLCTKPVTVQGKYKTLVAVSFRGTDVTDLRDDISDLLIARNEDGIHSGFARSAASFYEAKEHLVLDLPEGSVTLGQVLDAMKEEDSPYIMLVTGHSLGAAIADVLVGREFYRAGILPSNVLAVTFGTPKTVSEGYTYPYKNIINILNEDDIVPTIGADRQIGQNLVFQPTETFRQSAYGDAYTIGSELGHYNTVFSAAATGFIGHKMTAAYWAIVQSLAQSPAEYLTD